MNWDKNKTFKIAWVRKGEAQKIMSEIDWLQKLLRKKNPALLSYTKKLPYGIFWRQTKYTARYFIKGGGGLRMPKNKGKNFVID